jgi:hypothetical protein
VFFRKVDVGHMADTGGRSQGIGNNALAEAAWIVPFGMRLAKLVWWDTMSVLRM